MIVWEAKLRKNLLKLGYCSKFSWKIGSKQMKNNKKNGSEVERVQYICLQYKFPSSVFAYHWSCSPGVHCDSDPDSSDPSGPKTGGPLYPGDQAPDPARKPIQCLCGQLQLSFTDPGQTRWDVNCTWLPGGLYTCLYNYTHLYMIEYIM